MMVRRVRKYRSVEDSKHNVKQKKKESFQQRTESAQSDGIENRKISNSSAESTKHKWLKAFKNLKTTQTSPSIDKRKKAMYHAVSTVVISRKNLESESGGHQWREYTYRKITPCDACGQILRGHAHQGFRCLHCKVNAHADCIHAVRPVGCSNIQSKRGTGILLLRKQKSSALTTNDTPSSEQMPHNQQHFKKHLSFHIKSLSLDSLERSTYMSNHFEEYQNKDRFETIPSKHSDFNSVNQHSIPSRSSSSTDNTQKEHLRRDLQVLNFDDPEENKKYYLSANSSPYFSFFKMNQNQNILPHDQILLLNNFYVVLYDFEGRRRDDLNLKAGYKITVTDTSDKDWWKGKHLEGRIGFFPSTYVMQMKSGQKALQVIQNMQMADQTMLLRNQIVVQVSEEVDGVINVKYAVDVLPSSHTNNNHNILYKRTLCPMKYLSEV